MADENTRPESRIEPAAPPPGTEAEAAPVAIDETDRLIASDKVAGTSVYGAGGERLGSVYNFMVDKASGQVAYAVMSFGGFLGLGERFYPLPWKALTYDPVRGGYVIQVDRETLEKAPSYSAEDQPWADPAYGHSLYGFYGLPFGM